MRLSMCAAIAALAFTASTAFAGVFVYDYPDGHWASGEMRTASVNGGYIYCSISGNALACGAFNGTNRYAYCYTDDYKMKRQFAAVGKTATVTFFWNPLSGQCERINVMNGNRINDRHPHNPVHSTVPTGVDLASRYAYGTVSAKPANPDSLQGIFCSANVDWILCAAITNNDVVGECRLGRDSAWQKLDDMEFAVAGINESSYIFFSWDDQSPANCTEVYVSNGSFNLP